MATLPSERTGVLVIRAWIEGEPASLRLRITRTLDISSRDEEATAAASIDEACAVVRRWLDDFVTGS